MRLLYAFLLAILMAAAPVSLTAMHILGGEMTYEMIEVIEPGIQTYRFKLTLYRDCNSGGSQFDTPAEIAVHRGTAAGNVLVQGYKANNPVSTLLTANAPFNICIERGVYTFVLTLPVLADESYFVTHQRCCRSLQVTNIAQPGNVGFTISTELTPAAQAGGNRSAVFSEAPPLWLCSNSSVDLTNFTATDADGDSLVYELCAPLLGGGPLLQPQSVLQSCEGARPTPPCGPPFSEVFYASLSFNAADPLGPGGEILLDPATGALTGSVSQLGLYALGVCVREYRNGALIATTRRDYSVNSLDCVVPTAQLNRPAIDLQAAPNPAREWLKLRVETADRGRLTVMSADGRIVWQTAVPAGPSPQALAVDVHGWSAGNYVLRLDTATGSTTLAVVIAR
jgi:hypothetical protein